MPIGRIIPRVITYGVGADDVYFTQASGCNFILLCYYLIMGLANSVSIFSSLLLSKYLGNYQDLDIYLNPISLFSIILLYLIILLNDLASLSRAITCHMFMLLGMRNLYGEWMMLNCFSAHILMQ